MHQDPSGSSSSSLLGFVFGRPLHCLLSHHGLDAAASNRNIVHTTLCFLDVRIAAQYYESFHLLGSKVWSGVLNLHVFQPP